MTDGVRIVARSRMLLALVAPLGAGVRHDRVRDVHTGPARGRSGRRPSGRPAPADERSSVVALLGKRARCSVSAHRAGTGRARRAARRTGFVVVVPAVAANAHYRERRSASRPRRRSRRGEPSPSRSAAPDVRRLKHRTAVVSASSLSAQSGGAVSAVALGAHRSRGTPATSPHDGEPRPVGSCGMIGGPEAPLETSARRATHAQAPVSDVRLWAAAGCR